MLEIIRGVQCKAINTRIEQCYLTKAAREAPRLGPVFAAIGEVTIALTPHTWRSHDLRDFDDQFLGGLLGQTPEQWFLPLD